MGILRGDPTKASRHGRLLERFKPTTGFIMGYLGLAAAAFAVVYAAVSVHTVTGLRIALGALLAGVVIYVSQLRPRAAAYENDLFLRNSLSDVWIPYVVIDEVAVGQTLNIWVGGQRYVCIGIGLSVGKDIRQRAKKQRQTSLLGTNRLHEFSEKAELAAPDQTAMSYHTFVVTRIEELVDRAKRAQRSTGAEVPPVTKSLAVPEVVALAVTGLAFLVSLFV